MAVLMITATWQGTMAVARQASVVAAMVRDILCDKGLRRSITLCSRFYCVCGGGEVVGKLIEYQIYLNCQNGGWPKEK